MAEPSRTQRRLALVALFLLAFAIRFPLHDVQPYGDEGAFYYTARHLWHEPDNVHDLYLPDGSGLYPNVGYRPTPIFWYRPAHFLLLAPAAQIDFEAYRILNIAFTSLLPVVGAAYLLAHGTRLTTALAAGATLALAPTVVVWSGLTFPDAPMATWFVAGLLLERLKRPEAAGAAFLAAAWTKETALLGIAVVLALVAWRRNRSGNPWTWPLQLTRLEASLATALILGPVPLVVALGLGGAPPGGTAFIHVGWLLESPLLLPWLLLILVWGLAVPATRDAALLALAYPSFYLVYYLAARGAVNLWYLVLPVTLVVLACARILDDRWRNATDPAPRRFTATAIAIVLLLVSAAVFLPNSGTRSLIMHPMSGASDNALLGALEFEEERDDGFLAAFQAAGVAPGRTVFAVDVYGSRMLHPLASSQAELVWGETKTMEVLNQSIEPWAPAIETGSDVTLLEVSGTALNQAIRETYAECVTHRGETYVVIEASGCQGRADALATRWSQLRSP